MADTSSIAVRASVRGSCVITSADDVDFGTLETGDVTSHEATANVQYWCSNGLSYTLALDDGLHAGGPGQPAMKRTTGVEKIPYSVTITPTSGIGLGPTPSQTAVVKATIEKDHAQAASVGDYEDTLTVTLEP